MINQETQAKARARMNELENMDLIKLAQMAGGFPGEPSQIVSVKTGRYVALEVLRIIVDDIADVAQPEPEVVEPLKLNPLPDALHSPMPDDFGNPVSVCSDCGEFWPCAAKTRTTAKRVVDAAIKWETEAQKAEGQQRGHWEDYETAIAELSMAVKEHTGQIQ